GDRQPGEHDDGNRRSQQALHPCASPLKTSGISLPRQASCSTGRSSILIVGASAPASGSSTEPLAGTSTGFSGETPAGVRSKFSAVSLAGASPIATAISVISIATLFGLVMRTGIGVGGRPG